MSPPFRPELRRGCPVCRCRLKLGGFDSDAEHPVSVPDGQMMVWYPGCRSAKIVKPMFESMSSTSITPPIGMAEAACSISNTVFSAVCRLSWINISTCPSLGDQRDGSRCLLEPSRYDQRGRHESVTTTPVSSCSRTIEGKREIDAPQVAEVVLRQGLEHDPAGNAVRDAGLDHDLGHGVQAPRTTLHGTANGRRRRTRHRCRGRTPIPWPLASPRCPPLPH